MAKTQALQALARAGVTHTPHRYEVREHDGSYGEAVALALGLPPERLFKTLVTLVDGAPAVGIVPVSGQLNLKALAKALGGKRAEMADPADAERWTGYVTGGISPFGQKRRMRTALDESALRKETIFVSGGQRGIQVEVSPGELVRLLQAIVAPIAS